jgi:hypothetical protein
MKLKPFYFLTLVQTTTKKSQTDYDFIHVLTHANLNSQQLNDFIHNDIIVVFSENFFNLNNKSQFKIKLMK